MKTIEEVIQENSEFVEGKTHRVYDIHKLMSVYAKEIVQHIIDESVEETWKNIRMLQKLKEVI